MSTSETPGAPIIDEKYTSDIEKLVDAIERESPGECADGRAWEGAN
jgi:hypothetical protein